MVSDHVAVTWKPDTLRKERIIACCMVVAVFNFFAFLLVAGLQTGPTNAPKDPDRFLRWSFLRECTLKAAGQVERPGEHCARAWADILSALDEKPSPER